MTEFTPEKYELRGGDQLAMTPLRSAADGASYYALAGVAVNPNGAYTMEWSLEGNYDTSESAYDIVPKRETTFLVHKKIPGATFTNAFPSEEEARSYAKDEDAQTVVIIKLTKNPDDAFEAKVIRP